MRTWLVICPLLALLGLVAACGDNDDGSPTPATTSTPLVTTASGLAVFDAFARAPTDTQAAAYFLVQGGTSPDRLVNVSSPAAKMAQLHQTVVEGSTSRMEPVDGFDIPAGGRLQLKPGASHIMLMSLVKPLQVGDVIQLELTFEKAGQVTIEARVEPAGPMQQGK